MSGKFHLDDRLSAILDFVSPNSVVADIGTDHGYLACALAERGISKYVFACDAALKPLMRAKKNITENCLSHKVETVLTNGLTDLPYSLIDTFVIAGMGGDLISKILLTHSWARDNHYNFILQPMTKPENLRKSLFENGFEIIKESSVISGSKVYTVMCVKYTERIYKTGIIYCYTGCHLYSCQYNSIVYVNKVLQKLEIKINGILKSKNPEKAEPYIRAMEEIRERVNRNVI